MTLPKHPYEREFKRFVETEDGEVAVRVSDDAARLSEDRKFELVMTALVRIDERLEAILNHARLISGMEKDKGDIF